MKASYLKLYEQGELQKRISRAGELLSPCRLCPRHCGVNRLQTGKLGICGTGEKAMVASYGPHFGEESPLVGKGGSGTIFFSHCNLLCIFCQNYAISHCPDQKEGVEALNRTVSNEEYQRAIQMAKQTGLKRLDQKDFSFLLKKLGIV